MGIRREYPQMIDVEVCECGNDRTVCRDSRYEDGIRYRSRYCEVCGKRFFTREVAETEWQDLVEYKQRTMKIMNTLRYGAWTECDKKLPQNPSTWTEMKEYLTTTEDGNIQTLFWADGWNCYVGDKGEFYKHNEITNIVAWKEIESDEQTNIKKVLQTIHDCVTQEAKIKAYEEILDKIDEGLCDLCEHNDMDGKCYKFCGQNDYEKETLLAWMKSQIKSFKESKHE